MTLFDFLNGTNNLDRAFRRQVNGVDCSDTVAGQYTLNKSCSVTENKEIVGFLRAITVNPGLQADSRPGKSGDTVQFRLKGILVDQLLTLMCTR